MTKLFRLSSEVYVCENCGMKFRHRINYDKHKKTHLIWGKKRER